MKTNETEAREMADDGMPVETAFLFDAKIVSSDLLPGCWDVVLNGERKGTIGIDRQGEFNVSMKDGIETYGEGYRLDSLRKASEWAITHLAYEEIGKGW